jgi:hypothetical protein
MTTHAPTHGNDGGFRNIGFEGAKSKQKCGWQPIALAALRHCPHFVHQSGTRGNASALTAHILREKRMDGDEGGHAFSVQCGCDTDSLPF